MSDFRREPLISLGTKSVNNEKSNPISRSVRISVTLPESTEDGYPEFNFRDELAAWKKKHLPNNVQKQQNGMDPFNNDDDDDVRRIAQEMEAKYGVSSKKKRRWKKDEYADIGMGYDESDSFIDNTDGYDEMVPKNVTTLHGGFYINSGALEFKTDDEASSDESSSSSSEEEEITDKPNMSTKRTLTSSSESDSDEKQKNENREKKQKLSNGNANGLQKALKNKLFSDDKIKKVRKNSTDNDKRKAVRELVKEKREDLNMSVPLDNSKTEYNASTPTTTAAATTTTTTATVATTIVTATTTLANVDTVIESVINAANGNIQTVDESSKDSSASKEVNKSTVTNSVDIDSNDDSPHKQEESVKLPDNLQQDVVKLIDDIKRAAAETTEGKVKFFSGPVSTILLSLERKCRTLKKSTRVRIYEHLAPFVRCRKETLVKRAKNLILEDEQKKVKYLLERLQGEIRNIMPNLLQNYEIESRKIVGKKLSKENLDNEDSKALRMPKRRFAWTEETRKLLREIVSLQKKCLLMEGKNKDKLDELMNTFLKTKVQILWPEGWMSMNVLQKFSNPDYRKSLNTSSPNVKSSVSEVSKESISTSLAPKAVPSLTSKSSSLTITPIIPSDVQKSTEDQRSKSKLAAVSSDIIISNVNSSNYSIKCNKALPSSIEITKTILEPISATSSLVKLSHERDELQVIPQITAEDLSQKGDMQKPSPNSVVQNVDNSTTSQSKSSKSNTATEDCTVVDLTDSVELKRRPGPKSKAKYYIEDPEKPLKVKKVTSDKAKTKDRENISGTINGKECERYTSKDISGNYCNTDRTNCGMSERENLTGSYALDKLISDSLADSKCYSQTDSLSLPNFTSLQNSVECTPMNLGTSNSSGNINTSSVSYPMKPRHNQEGDDIQKVMEGLLVLHKMSSPAKSDDYVRTSAPASVITYNKSPSSSSTGMHPNNVPTSVSNEPKKHMMTSFQDAFQKQFIREYNMSKANLQSSASNSKNDYNSVSSSSHSSLLTNAKTSNNNYTQPYYNKLLSNIICQQQGSYNMLEDMFVNLLKESGCKSATDKSNVQQK